MSLAMATNKLKPQIASTELSNEHIWNVSSYLDLPRHFSPPLTDLFAVLEKRRSRRVFSEIDIQTLSALLWFALRHTGTFPGSSNRVSTPVPTFGGLASVRTLVLQSDLTCWIYDPVFHRAGIIKTDDHTKQLIRRDAENFFPIGEGVILLFAASRDYVSTFYTEPESLVLRESGVLTGTIALIAEAFDLAFCPLGTLGENWLCPLLNATEEIIISAGAAVIGGR